MTTQIATTIEQSRRLLALGAIPEKADMHYSTFIPDEPCLAIGEIVNDDDIPAWSLSAMMEILPSRLVVEHRRRELTARYDWHLYCYVGSDIRYVNNESLIEACVMMLELIEKK